MTNLTYNPNESSIVSNQISLSEQETMAITLWLANQKSVATKKQYTSVIKEFLIYIGGGLFELSEQRVLGYKLFIESQGYSQATIKNKLNAVKSLFSYLVRKHYIEDNPSEDINCANAKDTLNERILEINQITKLFSVINSIRDKALLAVLYYGGLRVSEAVNLKWEDLKADRLTIFGKGNKTRVIAIHPLALSLINQLKDNQSEYIFIGGCNRNRLGAITAKTAHQLIKKYSSLAGLGDNPSCHWLRHSIATHLVDSGVPVNDLRDFLGHSSIAVTNKYVHSRKGNNLSVFMPMVMLG